MLAAARASTALGACLTTVVLPPHPGPALLADRFPATQTLRSCWTTTAARTSASSSWAAAPWATSTARRAGQQWCSNGSGGGRAGCAAAALVRKRCAAAGWTGSLPVVAVGCRSDRCSVPRPEPGCPEPGFHPMLLDNRSPPPLLPCSLLLNRADSHRGCCAAAGRARTAGELLRGPVGGAVPGGAGKFCNRARGEGACMHGLAGAQGRRSTQNRGGMVHASAGRSSGQLRQEPRGGKQPGHMLPPGPDPDWLPPACAC